MWNFCAKVVRNRSSSGLKLFSSVEVNVDEETVVARMPPMQIRRSNPSCIGVEAKLKSDKRKLFYFLL